MLSIRYTPMFNTVRRGFASSAPHRAPLTIQNHIYYAKATAEGPGRTGSVKSGGELEETLDLKLATPKSMGGKGDGQNPEQLFAMGYAACFLGALQLVAGKAGKSEQAANAKIHATVRIGPPQEPQLPGFGLAVTIEVEGVKSDKLITQAHEFCPYSRMAKYGAEVTLKKT